MFTQDGGQHANDVAMTHPFKTDWHQVSGTH